MREEEASLPSKGPSKNKTAQKKTRSGGLDDALGAFDAPAKKGATLNASGIDNALDALSQSAAPLVLALHIDLADLRGYHYHNGAIFSVFTAGEPNAVGKGGRYDGIGKAFGRARPATGFTLDLRQLAGLLARA